MFDNFTDHIRKAMALANREAIRFGSKFLDTDHILLGLIKEGNGVGITILKNLTDVNKLRKKIEKPIKTKSAKGNLPITPATKKVIGYAIEEARLLNDKDVGTQHFLLGLLRVPDEKAASALADAGLKYEHFRKEVLKFSNNKPKETGN